MSFTKDDFLKFSDFLIRAAGQSKESLANVIDNAKSLDFIEVVIPPFLVKSAADKLKGTKVKIVTTLDFPYGLLSGAEKCALVHALALAGASIIEISPNVSAVKDGDFKTMEAEYALISGYSQKFKGVTLRYAVNELLHTDLERDNLCHYLGMKKIPYRVLSLNSIDGSSSAYSFNEDFNQKVIRINMDERRVYFESIYETLEKADDRERPFLFGRALCSSILTSEVDARSNPRGGYNKIVIAPAALAGSGVCAADCLSVGAKSPKSERIKIITHPCRTSRALAGLGIIAIIIEGPAPGYHYLIKISKGNVQLLSAENFLGLNSYEFAARLKDIHGDNCSYLIQGPMAAFDSHIATISADDAAGNPDVQFSSGFGLLMRQFGVNAIVIDNSEREEFCGMFTADKKAEYERLCEAYCEGTLKNPVVREQIMPYGTSSMVMPLYESGALPIARFTKFDSADVNKISGAALREAILKKKGEYGVSCVEGCPVKCKNVYCNEKKQKTAYLEYEHLASFMSMNEIYDIDLMAKLLHFCREKGLDFIELSYAIGEILHSGVLKGKPAEIVCECLNEIEKQTLMGKILLKGEYAAATAVGKEPPLTILNEAMPPYDPRALMGLGVSYLSSPIGAEEKSAGFTVPVSVQKAGGFVAGNKPDGQLELSRNMQVAYYMMDTFGVCHNLIYPLLDNPDLWNFLVKIISLRYNTKLNIQDVIRLVKKLIKEECRFNSEADHKGRAASLPELFYEARNEKSRSVFCVSAEAIEKIYETWQ